MDKNTLSLLRAGVHVWNDWRSANPKVRPDFSGADVSGHLGFLPGLFAPVLVMDDDRVKGSSFDLRNYNFDGMDFERSNVSGIDFRGCSLVGASFASATLSSANLAGLDLRRTLFRHADLQSVDLRGADLRGANLFGAHLLGANLSAAKLSGAMLDFATLVEADLTGADLTRASVYGVSAWSLKTDTQTCQVDLLVHSFRSESIRVDSLELAQFVYLLLQDKKFRDLIETLTSKVVLILGRFVAGRKEVLDRLRDEFRSRGYLPVVFDFDRPSTTDLSETIRILAGLSVFVVADITNPRSAPLELQATVPDWMTPFVPILQEGEQPFSMFADLGRKYHWVLSVLVYDTVDSLMKVLDESVIEPALQKRREISIAKSSELETRHVRTYRDRGAV